MPDSEEKLDEKEAVKRLNAALELQYRSALQYSLTAASLTGIEAQALGSQLTGFGDLELADARRLIEKIVSFGGDPTTTVAELQLRQERQERSALAGGVRGSGRRAAAGSDRADRSRRSVRGARAPDAST